jgi:CRISPR-associated protein Cmr3
VTDVALEAVFLEPLDLLVLRGNRLFSAGGAHGEALMPPWPSVAAGSLRSRMLVDAGVDPGAFARGACVLEGKWALALGTSVAPGSFRVRHFGLARRTGAAVEMLHGFPADLVFDNGQFRPVVPRPLPQGITSSYPLGALPMLSADRAKQDRGWWLTPRGFALWQAGEAVPVECAVRSNELWSLDSRLGIAMDSRTGTAREGGLYTTEAVAMRDGVGFLVAVQGAQGVLPLDGLLRFGGDGRAASVRPASFEPPQPDSANLARERRFRLVLTTPGIFADGWRLPGMGADGSWRCGDFSARLVSAAADRLVTISGWDLVRDTPKPALRAVPPGAVYWFDSFEGDADALQTLVAAGLTLDDPARRAEGFNNCLLASWPRAQSHAARVS